MWKVRFDKPKSPPKSKEIKAWTPRSSFLCSQAPLDRSMVPKVQKRTQSPCQITVNGKICDIETTSSHQRTSTNLSRAIRKRYEHNNKQMQRGQRRGRSLKILHFSLQDSPKHALMVSCCWCCMVLEMQTNYMVSY